MRSFLAVCLLLVVSPLAAAQSATIRATVRSEGKPVPDAEVSVGSLSAKTDVSGVAVLSVPPGEATVVVLKDKFAPASAVVAAVAGQQQDVEVNLVEQPTVEETVTVSATRTDGRLEDQPIRVEVLDREEIEEKLLMTPGDIVMMLNEMGGMRVQATSPSIGAASVRVQGMRGRYTRFLSDGLPLFGEVGGLGLLQIPPMDLGQVEVIKGVASSLYGADAMGGVVNLISRQPGAKATTEVLLNRSTRGATDAVMFAGIPMSRGWAMTLLGGAHRQELFDADGDGWSDLPKYSRGIARPRLFWSDDKGNRFFATGGIFERTIDKESYQRLRNQLRAEMTVAELELGDARFDELEVDGLLGFAEYVLANLVALWTNAEMGDRRRIQDALFPNGLVWDGERIGTAVTIPAFNWLAELSRAENQVASPTGLDPFRVNGCVLCRVA